MRTLLLFRGAPGCGKSTYIDQHGLRPYALSADEIRLLCQSKQQTITGTTEISQKNDQNVWPMLFKLLNIRMSYGEFTVVDATNSKSVELNRYKELADQYRYRIYCIDFTDLPIEECKRRNALRDEYKRVPDYVIDKMYARFTNQKIPSGITMLKPDELDKIYIKKFDMSNYDKIVHIGDIHGCYTALMEYFKDGLNDNYMYIFTGDFIDGGIENAEVLEFMFSIYNKSNVFIIEGDHDRTLWIYAHGGTSYNNEFEFNTRPQLENAHIDYKNIRQFYRRFGQCAWYTYDNKEVFVSHGGIATMPENLSYMCTSQMINGVGSKNDYETISDTWMNSTKDNMYQIYGHRNAKNEPVKIRERVFNLNGSVEYGGCLRIVELDKYGFHTIEIKNDVFKKIEDVEENTELITSSMADTIINLRQNNYIQEKTFGNISSFNFTKNAFYDKIWNKQTIVARGLYINTHLMKIVARGYNKFFNINERPETKLEMLQYSLQFPVTCYVKENGFLGLVSYNEETDNLFITTKSNPEGDAAIMFKNVIDKLIDKATQERIKNICKEENVTFVFECVDIKNDPHIIEYEKDHLYLLSIIKNTITFEQIEYDKLVTVAKELNLEYKEKAFVIESWPEFYDWYNTVTAEGYLYKGKNIEGFVIEDSNCNMVKVKLNYYCFWKFMRGIAYTTLKNGYITRTGTLTNKLSNEFYAFLQNLYNNTDPDQRELIPRNIVYLRNEFYLSKGDK